MLAMQAMLAFSVFFKTFFGVIDVKNVYEFKEHLDGKNTVGLDKLFSHTLQS